MEKLVKLLPKQLEVLTQIQTQKQTLNKAFQELNEKEGLLMSFVLETAGITEADVKQVELKEGNLVINLKEVEAKDKKDEPKE